MSHNDQNSSNSRDDKILIASLRDRMLRCSDNSMITSGTFLDLRQRSAVSDALSHTSSGREYHLDLPADVRCEFYGGYSEAERTVPVFVPYYISESIAEHFASDPDSDLLTVLRATSPKGSPSLSHRDYLGALMGIGIDRRMTGDILTCEHDADIIVLKEIAPFIEMNMSRAGRATLSFEMLPLSELRFSGTDRREIRASVASLRLDSLISSAFGLSRTRAHEAIAAGLVYLDDLQVYKPEKTVAAGSKLVLRGRGKAVLRSVEGTSAKGRTIIIIERFM